MRLPFVASGLRSLTGGGRRYGDPSPFSTSRCCPCPLIIHVHPARLVAEVAARRAPGVRAPAPEVVAVAPARALGGALRVAPVGLTARRVRVAQHGRELRPVRAAERRGPARAGDRVDPALAVVGAPHDPAARPEQAGARRGLATIVRCRRLRRVVHDPLVARAATWWCPSQRCGWTRAPSVVAAPGVHAVGAVRRSAPGALAASA